MVLSCFFQNLTLTPMNVNFLSLDRAVRHYGDLMDVWLRMRELGGFDWMETRYEDIVAGLEREGRRATEFLGLTWHPAQAASHEAARRKMVFSPTYHEVAQPVYNRAIGRWKHYAAALEPFQQRLSPYCRALGYGDASVAADVQANQVASGIAAIDAAVGQDRHGPTFADQHLGAGTGDEPAR